MNKLETNGETVRMEKYKRNISPVTHGYDSSRQNSVHGKQLSKPGGGEQKYLHVEYYRYQYLYVGYHRYQYWPLTYSSSFLTQYVNCNMSRYRRRWEGNVARMERYAHIILVGKPEGRTTRKI